MAGIIKTSINLSEIPKDKIIKLNNINKIESKVVQPSVKELNNFK